MYWPLSYPFSSLTLYTVWIHFRINRFISLDDLSDKIVRLAWKGIFNRHRFLFMFISHMWFIFIKRAAIRYILFVSVIWKKLLPFRTKMCTLLINNMAWLFLYCVLIVLIYWFGIYIYYIYCLSLIYLSRD